MPRMNTEFVTMTTTTGSALKGERYRVLETGLDWFRISVGGRKIHVPQWAVS